jgi:hypothetical protein
MALEIIMKNLKLQVQNIADEYTREREEELVV